MTCGGSDLTLPGLRNSWPWSWKAGHGLGGRTRGASGTRRTVSNIIWQPWAGGQCSDLRRICLTMILLAALPRLWRR